MPGRTLEGMDAERAVALRWRIRLHGALLLAGMMGLAALLGHLLLGPGWIPWLAGLALLGLVSLPRLSPAWVMRMAGGRRLHPARAADLYRVMAGLARRAGLERVPALYYVPTGLPNAFAVGSPDDGAVAVTHGLLRALTPDELVGVLAHELAHVRSGDARVMLMADLVVRLTDFLSTMGVLLLVLNLPLVAAGAAHVPWLAVAVLLASPTLSVLLQLGLSRARERAADVEAAALTGDPRALARALRKIGAFEEGLLRQVLGTRSWGHALLRTHPRTEERVRDLLSLEERRLPEPLEVRAAPEVLLERLPGPRRHSLWLGP